MAEYRVFLSMVSSEFASARDAVAKDLSARGLTVKWQDIFRDEVEVHSLLQLLDHYIRDCDAVVCAWGKRSGDKPPAEDAAKFPGVLPDGMTEASYTQWEYFLARRYNRDIMALRAGDTFRPEKPDGKNFPGLQDRFLTAIERENRHTRPFNSAEELRIEVLKRDWPNLARGKLVNLPYPTLGPLFAGRADFLKQIRQSLTQGGNAAITAANAAIHGLGGIGKTRAAVEYAWAHQADYTALLFATAETAESLDSNLGGLTGVLGMPNLATQPDSEKVRAVLDWLNRHPGWLLILDNADSPDSLTRASALLGSLTQGHVLLTSRQANLPRGFQRLPLEVLAVEDAARYLLDATQDRARTKDDEAEARALAEELGQLALALTHAAAYINQLGLSFPAYRVRLRESFKDVMSWSDPVETGYPLAIPATWALSVDRLSEPARALLERLSFLAPEPVPLTLLDVPVPEVEATDGRAVLGELVRLSLASREATAGVFSLHRLVMEVTRRFLRPDAAKVRLTEALGWVNNAFAGDPHDVRTWPRLMPIADHAEVVALAAEKAKLDVPTGRLMGHLGLLFHARAQYGRANPLMRAALANGERTLGPDHLEVAARLNNLAGLLAATNCRTEAEVLYRRALAISSARLGPSHPTVADALNNLATVLEATNRLAEAEPLYRRALAIIDASLGPKHPSAGTYLNNLAGLLTATNRLAKARRLYRRALAIDEASFGPVHPAVATSLNNLAESMRIANHLSAAEPLYRRALAIDEATLGPDHPDVARDLNNLALLLRVTNRLAEAEPLVCRALTISKANLGPAHPTVATYLSNMAGLLEATTRLTEAEKLYRRALAIDEASLGPHHPVVARDLNNLANLLRATHRLAEAEPLSRRMLLIFLSFQRATGHAHPHRDTAVANHAAILQALGRTEAEIIAELRALLAEAGLDGL